MQVLHFLDQNNKQVKFLRLNNVMVDKEGQIKLLIYESQIHNPYTDRESIFLAPEQVDCMKKQQHIE